MSGQVRHRHVVMFSGGITSWAVARKVAAEHGTNGLTLLFADTRIEDEDLYRFAEEAAADIGVPLTTIADGRTPWEVFADQRIIGNSRIAPCSKLLKQVPCRRWLEKHTEPETTTVYVGIDWTETHRMPAIEAGHLPWTVKAPLCEPPFSDKADLLNAAREAGITPPRLYGLGFAHNNCGGACVRGGQAQWAHLMKVFPDRYAANEAAEQHMRRDLGKNVAILRDRRGGTVRPLPLTELRHRITGTSTEAAYDADDWGGCGCFTSTEENSMPPASRLHLVTDHPENHEVPPASTGPLWDMPVPLTGAAIAPPPFPLDVFPRWLGEMATGVARFTATDPAMAGTLAVAVLSACAGGRLEVEPVPGWREPVNIFTAVIAGPGERKSPVHRAMTAPLFAAQSTLSDAIRPRIAEAAALRDIADRQAEQAKAQAAKATDPGKRDDATADAVAAAIAAEAITVPGLPKLIVDDATPEVLINLMAANGGRMAIISDEGGIFDTLAGRYSASPNLDPYLKGHAGQPMSNERITREGASIEKPALTVCVMAQPVVLRQFGGNAGLAGRGLPARFLFALPASMAGYRPVDTPPVPEPVAAGYRQRVHDLAATFAEWVDPAVVVLTEEAGKVRRAAAEQVEAELRPGGSLHDMREWGNKLAGATLRLAGLLHVAHHPADAWQRPIDADRMADAVRLADFFAAHYRAAIATITADATTETARRVLAIVTAKGMNTFTRRELHRRCHRQLPRAADVTAVLDVLTAHGWIRTTDSGGYEVHPRAADHAPASGDTVTTTPVSHVSAAHST